MKYSYLNNNVGENRVLPFVCIGTRLHAMRAKLNTQFMLYQNICV